MSIDEELLTLFALKALESNQYRQLEKQIAASTELQEELRAIEQALLVVAEAEPEVAPRPLVRDQLMAALEPESRFSGYVERFCRLFDLDTDSTLRLLEQIDWSSAWKKTIFPGIAVLRFDGGPRLQSAICALVSVKPGYFFPAHRHHGEETIFVLQGAGRDDQDNVFLSGDLLHYRSDSRHSFQIISDDTCVFAVTLQRKNQWLWRKSFADGLKILVKKMFNPN